MEKKIIIISFILLILLSSPLKGNNSYKIITEKFTKQTKFNIASELNTNNPLAIRIDSYLKWLIEENKDRNKILEELINRYNYFTSKKLYPLTPSAGGSIGRANAPVEIIFYISTSCQECLEEAVELYNSVENGQLKRKVKLFVEPFRNKFGEKALIAAAKEGKFWEYLKELAQNESKINMKKLLNTAVTIGLNREKFKKDLTSNSTTSILKKAEKEAKKNNIIFSSTTFINRRKYQGSTDPKWIIDAALYEYQRRMR